MRVLCVLGLALSAWAQNSSNSSFNFTYSNSSECAPIVAPPDIVYFPPAYIETSRVAQLAGYTSVDFCKTLYSDYSSCSPYVSQLVGMGAVPIVLCALASVSLWFYLCCRSEKCCSCRLPFSKLWMSKLLLGVLLLCSFIAIYASFSGSGDFKAGANNLGAAISNVEATTANVNDQVVAGLAACDVLRNASTGIESGDCDVGNPFIDPDVRSKGTDILSQLSNVTGPLMSVQNEINFTGRLDAIRKAVVDNSSRNIDRAFYAIIGIYTLALLFGVMGLLCWPILLNAELCLGSINVIIAGIFIGLELGFSVGVSDFCYPNPRVQILSLYETSGGAAEAVSTLHYMMTCQGQNPVRNRSDDIISGMTGLQQKVCVFSNYSAPNPQCHNDTTNAERGLSSLVNSTYLFFNTIASCRFFNEPLVLLTDHAVCTNMVDGLYAMWTCQMVATIFLIMALFVTPCVKEQIREAEDPLGHTKKRSSTVAERRDTEDGAAAAHVSPSAPEEKHDDPPPPSYSSVEPPSAQSEVEMDTVQRDKLGDPMG